MLCGLIVRMFQFNNYSQNFLGHQKISKIEPFLFFSAIYFFWENDISTTQIRYSIACSSLNFPGYPNMKVSPPGIGLSIQCGYHNSWFSMLSMKT